MGIINVLDAQTANLIAAGEVVDRPASVIKELMENAIDAGATQITVETKNGGSSLMRVTDNGCGMKREDVPVSIKRHATSKIHSPSDLDGILTLGFRGEALAAISSVSHMRIMTKTKDDSFGTLLEAEGGEKVTVSDTGCPDGTTVMVEELFANVPARRKFLKKDTVETSAVAAVVEKIALSRPDISFRLICDGNIRFSTAGNGKLIDTIYAVLGRDFAKKLIEVNDMTEGIGVKGYIGSPENVRGNRNYQNFFINGRYIRSGTASAALEQAFSSYMPVEKFPCCVLTLTIHPSLVDINVHPAKLEVKFSNEKLVFNAVFCAVRNALMQKLSRPERDLTAVKHTGEEISLYGKRMTEKLQSAEAASVLSLSKDLASASYEQLGFQPDGSAAGVKTSLKENAPLPSAYTSAEKSDENPQTGGAVLSGTSPGAQNLKAEEQSAAAGIKPAQSNVQPEITPSDRIFGIPVPEQAQTDADAYPITIPPLGGMSGRNIIPDEILNRLPRKTESLSRPEEVPLPWYRIAGVAFNCYVLVELKDRMLVVDKHAAHERILYEDMKLNMQLADVVSQILLMPLPVCFSPEEYGAVLQYSEDIKAIGFDFEEAGDGRALYLLQLPAELDAAQCKAMLETLASSLSRGETSASVSREILYEKALYQASCKAAVKGGREDDPEHIKWIVEKLLRLPDIKYCPHGRPVAIEMTKSEFEKQFERT